MWESMIVAPAGTSQERCIVLLLGVTMVQAGTVLPENVAMVTAREAAAAAAAAAAAVEVGFDKSLE